MNKVLSISLIAAISPMAIETLVAILPTVAAYYMVEQGVVQSGMSLYLLFFSIGIVFWGPVLDRTNERNLLVFGLIIFSIISLSTSFIDKQSTYNIARCVLGFFGAIPSVSAIKLIKLNFSSSGISIAMAKISLLVMLVPMFAPIIGVYITNLYDWRFIPVLISLVSLGAIYCSLNLNYPSYSPGKSNFKSAYFKYVDFLLDRRVVTISIVNGVVFSSFYVYVASSILFIKKSFNIDGSVFSMILIFNSITLAIATYIGSKTILKGSERRSICFCVFIQLLMSVSMLAASLLSFNYVIYFSLSSIYLSVISLVSSASTSMLIKEDDKVNTIISFMGFMKFGISGLLSWGVVSLGINSPFKLAVIFIILSSISNILLLSFSAIKTNYFNDGTCE